jgi:hypothetical protein
MVEESSEQLLSADFKVSGDVAENSCQGPILIGLWLGMVTWCWPCSVVVSRRWLPL